MRASGARSLPCGSAAPPAERDYPLGSTRRLARLFHSDVRVETKRAFQCFFISQEIFAEDAVYSTTNWDMDHDRMARYRQDVIHGWHMGLERVRASGRQEQGSSSPHPAERDYPLAKGSNKQTRRRT
jgi:hypothetical protein